MNPPGQSIIDALHTATLHMYIYIYIERERERERERREMNPLVNRL